MKRRSEGRGVQFWAVLAISTVGVLLVAGMGAVDAAGAGQIASGQVRAGDEGNNCTFAQVHCAVVNLGSAAITVRVAIINGNNGTTCNDDVQTIDPFEARGVNCSTGDGAYCLVTGTFDKNKVRGSVRARCDGLETEALPLQ